MEETKLLDTIERYLSNQMSAEEKAWFENLRNTNPEIDQLVVEHTMFLHQLDLFAESRAYRHNVQEVHNKLADEGVITNYNTDAPGKVVSIWKRYRRLSAVAAMTGLIFILVISSLISYYVPAKTTQEIRELDRKLQQINKIVNVQSTQISEIKSKVPVEEKAQNGGTSFLVDGKGLLVTNAHVVRGASTILVQNHKGQQFKTEIAYIDNLKDLAILKINDSDFKPVSQLPYGIRNTSLDLGEQIFTLGYPRDEIVYNEGYASAKTGYNGDTVTCQIAVSANPGNSGGPVMNKNGDVVGVVSASQTTAEGVVFAIKSRNILQAIDELKKDTSYQKIKTPTSSSIKGIDRVQQIKQIQDCVFMVRTFTR